jgi:hypothetical protein
MRFDEGKRALQMTIHKRSVAHFVIWVGILHIAVACNDSTDSAHQPSQYEGPAALGFVRDASTKLVLKNIAVTCSDGCYLRQNEAYSAATDEHGFFFVLATSAQVRSDGRQYCSCTFVDPTGAHVSKKQDITVGVSPSENVVTLEPTK